MTFEKDIAIIGMAGLFPGARNIREYWQNILDKVNAVHEAPDEWSGSHLDPNSKENDRIYTRHGGFLGKLAEFNPVEFGIMPNSVSSAEPDHFLALRIARDALFDAGYGQRNFDREKAGIVLGRGTYINRGYTTLLQHGIVVDQTLNLLRQINPDIPSETIDIIRKELKASIPPFNAETVPNLVPNVITGRIANRLNLMGPNYLIDAACASSLIAVELAIRELKSGRCDMMLAGGVHTSTPAQLYMMFCQIGALSRSQIRPFDKAADGTLLGEGLGFLVLKRLADAERDGDRIYAVIKGLGSSSDGKALGLLAPRLEGQVLALKRAYEDSEIDPKTVNLVEAHGTGMPLGDQTELQSLTQVFGERKKIPLVALGTVKSMIGHCIPAAGIAGTIKTALALYHKILPPTLCDEVNPNLGIEKTSFYINNEARPWIHGFSETPRRAGINAFGFGGINAHAVLEEYIKREPSTQTTEERGNLSSEKSFLKTQNIPSSHSLLHSKWTTELVILSAQKRHALINLIENILSYLQANPDTALADLAHTLSRPDEGYYRLAIVAKDISDLEAKLNFALEKLKEPERSRLQTRSGIYYADLKSTDRGGKTAFLFPGEGSQYPNMLADLCLYFPKVRQWFDFLDRTFAQHREHPPSHFIFPPPTSTTPAEKEWMAKQLFVMDVASETVFTASMALYELIKDFGVESDFMVGHSTGEFASLIASDTVRLDKGAELADKIRYLNGIYRNLETTNNIARGALLTVGNLDLGLLEKLDDEFDGRVYWAMDNCPNQAVVFASEGDIEAVTARMKQAGGICTRLPFDRAYHTPLFEGVGSAFRAYYDSLEVGPGHSCLYSCATASAFPTDPEQIRALASQQWYSQVRFRETIENLYQAGVRTFIEVGPRSNLTGFVEDILKGRDFLALASNSQRKSGLEQIQHLLARLFANGIKVDVQPLYQGRELAVLNLEAGISEATAPKKASPVLDVSMPVMRLSPDLIGKIQENLKKSPVKNNEDDRLIHPSRSATLPQPLTSQEKITPYIVEPANLQPASNLPNIPPVAPIVPAETSVEDRLSDSILIPIPTTPTLTTDPNLSILLGHFELMQEFLDNQARVTTALYANLGSGDRVVDLSPMVTLTPDTLSYEEAWPLLGQIIEVDSQHLYCQRCFDINRDIFLYDHTLGSKLSERYPELFPLAVIPFTISMEIITEAAAYLVGGDKVAIGLYNLRGYRWLALDRGQIIIEIDAQLQPPQNEEIFDVYVRLFQAGTPKTTPVFEGYVRLAHQFPSSPPPLPFNLDQPKASWLSDENLYRTGMFHGPRFQGVKHIRCWGDQGIEADLKVISIDDFFSDIQRPVFQIDAGLLDAAGQLVGYWISERYGTGFNVFPFQVKAFHQYEIPLPPGNIVVGRGLIRFTSPRQTEASFDFLDETGRVIARLEGWQDRYFDFPDRYHECRREPQTAYLSDPWMQAETGLICRRIEPFAEHFLDDSWGIWKRVLAHLMLNNEEREFWYGLPEKGNRRNDWLLGRIAAKDTLRQWAKQMFNLELAPVDVQILANEMGKPLVTCPELEAYSTIPDISISHSQNYVVAALTPAPMQIGIDIQRLDGIRAEDLLSGAFTSSEMDLLAGVSQAEKGTAIIALWCAKEAAAKASGLGLEGAPKGWRLSNYHFTDQLVTVDRAGESFHVKLYSTDAEVLAICQHLR